MAECRGLNVYPKPQQANYGRRPKPGEEPEAETVEPDRLASGPIPKVCSRNNLGGRGGQVFGSTFGGGADVVPDGASTLPRRSTSRQSSVAIFPLINISFSKIYLNNIEAYNL